MPAGVASDWHRCLKCGESHPVTRRVFVRLTRAGGRRYEPVGWICSDCLVRGADL